MLCFVLGSKKTEEGQFPLEFPRTVEYLHYSETPPQVPNPRNIWQMDLMFSDQITYDSNGIKGSNLECALPVPETCLVGSFAWTLYSPPNNSAALPRLG